MKKVLSIIFCIGIIFCLASCQFIKPKPPQDSTNSESNSTNTEPVASFNTVEDFKVEIKKNPTLYNDKQVSVKGYANELTLLNKKVWLYDVLLADDELYDDRPRIEVIITDSVLLAVVEDGDYIEVCGTVTISNGEIYLSNCTYTMITPYEERQ